VITGDDILIEYVSRVVT
jgi:hydroxylamine reductase (hybrid-cluster protein)